MRKVDYWKERILKEKREKKTFKRRRYRPRYKSIFSVEDKVAQFKQNHDEKVVSKAFFDFHLFLESIFLNNCRPKTGPIKIPKVFCLVKEYEEVLSIARQICVNLYSSNEKEQILDFSQCIETDTASIFFLRVFISEYIEFFRKLDKKLLVSRTEPKIRIIKSKNDKVNIQLLLLNLLKSAEGKDIDLEPISATGIYKGERSQKHYLENKKGVAATIVVAYINECLSRHEFELTKDQINNLTGIISEVLNNAEDHSPMTEWYLTANLLEETKVSGKSNVGELNLAFLNFGYSIHEGFEKTKNENYEVYEKMNDLFNYIMGKYPHCTFTKENLFTLYALQDGFSRLKFESESRGTGTMKFINSFMELGDYEDDSKGFKPSLQIVSGNTRIVCDNEYKPFLLEDLYFISLNKKRSLIEPPEPSHLRQLRSRFPGTLLSVKVYLNKDHLKQKKNGTVKN